MKFAVVILAGGMGRRIGGRKPLRMLAGRSLLEHAFARAGGWSTQVVAAVRDPDQLEGASVATIADAEELEGPLGGLAAALAFARREGLDAVLTIPADMPFLPDDLPARLTGSIGSRCAAIAASGGNLHPVCGLWRVAALDLLPGFAASGQRSLRRFAESAGMISVSWEANPHDPFFNINSPEDLAAAEKFAAR